MHDGAIDFLLRDQHCACILLLTDQIILRWFGPRTQQSCHVLTSFLLNVLRHPSCDRVSARTAQPSCGWVRVR